MRYSVAGEIVGAWGNLGGLGEMFTNLAHLLELSVARNMEAASRFDKAQSAAWPHLQSM